MRLPLTAIVFLAASGPCLAQGFSSVEIERGMRPGAYVPYEGANFQYRYSYDTGPFLFLNSDSRNLWMMDYLDRADRADKFGYAPPRDPFAYDPAPHEPVVRPARVGLGFGIFRRR